MSAVTTRMEHDLPGDRKIPAAAYYDVRTLENFDIGAEIVLKRKPMHTGQGTEVLRPAVLTRLQMIQPQIA